MLVCQQCGQLNQPKALFCKMCGTEISFSADALPEKETGKLFPDTELAGRYIIIKKLSQGGQGAVYLVRDQRFKEKYWAVKEISVSGFRNVDERQQAFQAFEAEANMLASLNHPNLPKVPDNFEDNNKKYLVMDFVEGATLETALANHSGPLPEDRVLAWASQLCDVLTYLHTQEPPIIFRDLKPANIMVQADGMIKLIDFGIARLFKSEKSTDTVALGTPGYAPPEQYGQRQTDARSDVYALGATLHHLLTGRSPSDSSFQFRPIREFNSSVSLHVQAAVGKALNMDPSQRWQTIREMCLALSDKDYKYIEQPNTKANQPPFPQPIPVQQSQMHPSVGNQEWVVDLFSDSAKAKGKLFRDTRGHYASHMVKLIESEDITTRSMLLYGMEGFGGTYLALKVKDKIVRKKRSATLMIHVNLSPAQEYTASIRMLEDILYAMRVESGTIRRKLRRRVRKVYRILRFGTKPGPGNVEQTLNTQHKLPLQIDLSLGVISGSLSYEYNRTNDQRTTSDGESGFHEQQLSKLLAALKELIDLLSQNNVRVVVVFDKLKEISFLDPLVHLLIREGIYTIAVADQLDYVRWQAETPDKVKNAFKVIQYVPCLWQLSDGYLASFRMKSAQLDTVEYSLFKKYLKYRTRGVPRRLWEIEWDAHVLCENANNIWNKIRRIFQPTSAPIGRFHVEPARWPEVMRCAHMQDCLEEFWILLSVRDPATGGEFVHIPETMDRTKIAFYKLTDWMMGSADRREKHSQKAIVDYGVQECFFPFNDLISKNLIEQFILHIRQFYNFNPTNSGYNLAQLFTTSHLHHGEPQTESLRDFTQE